MKKLFICVMTSLCSTFAFADADLVVKPATISGGNGTMEVVINKANTTAFQFDVALPAGVSATGFSLAGAPATRKFEQAHYNAETNTYRFLTYDEGNAGLGATATFNIALAAADGAVTGVAQTENVLLVDPDGNGTDVAGANTDITVNDGATITIGSSGATTYVSNVDLDFTNSGLKAYVVMGVDIVDGTKGIWQASVSKVPANTPIVVTGPEGTHTVDKTTLKYTYYDNLLVGNNSDADAYVDATGGKWFFRLGTKGFSEFTGEASRKVGAHKAYICVDPLPAAKVGSNVPITIGEGNVGTSLCADVDLDFSDNKALKAYTVMGYDEGVMIASVNQVSAGTPLYIEGPAGSYSITSKATQAIFTNLMIGNNTDEKITIQPTETKDGVDYQNLFIGSAGFTVVSGTRSVGAHKSYVQIKKDYYKAPATVRGDVDGCVLSNVEVVEVIRSVVANDNDNTTGIRSIDEGQFTNDTWYNLNGQRIDTPAKKGLYIKNGKKVLVK